MRHQIKWVAWVYQEWRLSSLSRPLIGLIFGAKIKKKCGTKFCLTKRISEENFFLSTFFIRVSVRLWRWWFINKTSGMERYILNALFPPSHFLHTDHFWLFRFSCSLSLSSLRLVCLFLHSEDQQTVFSSGTRCFLLLFSFAFLLTEKLWWVCFLKVAVIVTLFMIRKRKWYRHIVCVCVCVWGCGWWWWSSYSFSQVAEPPLK